MAGSGAQGTGGPLRDLAPLFNDAGVSRTGPDLAMSGVPLEEIAAKAGTPTYVYNADVIRRSYQALDEAFAGIPHKICYAVKANSAPEIKPPRCAALSMKPRNTYPINKFSKIIGNNPFAMAVPHS